MKPGRMAANAARKLVTRALELEIRTRTFPNHVVVGRRISGLENVTSGGHNYYASGTAFSGPVVVGMATTINRDCEIAGPVTIGNYCQLAPRCAILATGHPTNRATVYTNHRLLRGELQQFSPTTPITLGNGVWIGHGAVILKGVTIGNGAIVGAGTVVTHSLPPYSVAVGNPARVARSRLSEDMIKVVEHSRWWTLPPETLTPFRSFFTTVLDSPSAEVLGAVSELACRIRAAADHADGAATTPVAPKGIR